MAAADHAEGKGPPPIELSDAWTSQRWGLPYTGGWRQQPVGVFEKMQTALNVFETVKMWRESKNWSKFATEHPERWKLVKKVIALRQEHGNKR